MADQEFLASFGVDVDESGVSRLQQIREMTGIHLEDQKEMLALQLSFYLLQEH